MAVIPRSYVDALTQSLNTLSIATQTVVRAQLSAITYTDFADLREQVIAILEPLLSTATDLSAAYAAQTYDSVRELSLGEVEGAIAHSGRVPEATEGAVRALIDKAVNGSYQAFVDAIADRCDYEIKRAAGESVLYNAENDRAKPRFARVPTGAETCEFCLMLASRGFVYRSEESAGALSHWHPHCDCRIVQGYPGDTVEGYDPDELYRQWREAEQEKARNPEKREGAINGALNDDNDPDGLRRERHAVRYYEEVRKRDSGREVATVSKNANLDSETVKKAYEHLFIDEHDLDGGHRRFDESYDIAESWRRLREGRDLQLHDKLLLLHESLEADYMDDGMSYEEAHNKANESYNYEQALLEFNRANR